MYEVYVVTCKTNGRMYVRRTGSGAAIRYYNFPKGTPLEHRPCPFQNKHFRSDWEAFGAKSFSMRVWMECETEAEAITTQELIIERLLSIGKELYNAPLSNTRNVMETQQVDRSKQSIYTLICKPNKRVLVGHTAQAPNKLWNYQYHALRHNKFPNAELQDDWNAYGENAFVFRIHCQYPKSEQTEKQKGQVMNKMCKAGYQLYNATPAEAKARKESKRKRADALDDSDDIDLV